VAIFAKKSDNSAPKEFLSFQFLLLMLFPLSHLPVVANVPTCQTALRHWAKQIKLAFLETNPEIISDSAKICD
jgi:hypothetical protein